jgi:hypothetical protein
MLKYFDMKTLILYQVKVRASPRGDAILKSQIDKMEF